MKVSRCIFVVLYCSSRLAVPYSLKELPFIHFTRITILIALYTILVHRTDFYYFLVDSNSCRMRDWKGGRCRDGVAGRQKHSRHKSICFLDFYKTRNTRIHAIMKKDGERN